MTWLRALSLLALLAVAGPAAAQAVSLSVLAANPVRYDHRTVTVTGCPCRSLSSGSLTMMRIR